MDVTTALEPLSELEKSRLREKLPLKIANFLIRRADDAVRLRETRGDTDTTFLSRLLRDLPSDVVDWENAENKEYRSYVYETSLGAPSFRRRGSSLFGGGDGLPDLTPPGEATMAGKEGGGEDVRRYSLFVGNVGGIDEQASKAGYSVLALLAIVIIAKLMFGLVSFFVSFTFSFFAIFALSAAIFMVFFLFKF